jgi:hypothetical protein
LVVTKERLSPIRGTLARERTSLSRAGVGRYQRETFINQRNFSHRKNKSVKGGWVLVDFEERLSSSRGTLARERTSLSKACSSEARENQSISAAAYCREDLVLGMICSEPGKDMNKVSQSRWLTLLSDRASWHLHDQYLGPYRTGLARGTSRDRHQMFRVATTS